VTTPEDRLRSELAGLADLPMPADVADRIEHATTRELLSSGGIVPLRARWRRVRAAVPIAAAAVAVVLAGAVADDGADTPRTVAQGDDLRATGAVAFGRDGAGALADPAARRACLTGVGVPEPGAALLGGMPYAVDGTPGTLLVLGTGETGRYRLVVVDPACARVLAQAVTGR
jgi:hypothetical protein